MFALQNLNLLLNNIPQMPTLAKYGLFQSSSITTIKRIPEIDVVLNELTQTIQLIKELKCERSLGFLAGTKFETLRTGEWSSVEDVVHKFTKGMRRESSSLDMKCKETVVSLTPFSDSNKVNETFSGDKTEDNSSEMLSSCSSSNPFHLNPTNSQPEECKKSQSIMSQFISFKNTSNQTIFKNGSLFVNPGGGVHLARIEKSPYQGQWRGFKTERQIQRDLNHSLLNRWAQLFIDKKSAGSQTESTRSEETGKDDGTDSKSSGAKSGQGGTTFMRSMADVLTLFRLILYGGCMILIYEFYQGFTSSKKFLTTVTSEKVNVSFDDAKGMEEAKAELQCVVEFLRDPAKFIYLGGKLPSGVLLEGPPGAGKTLLARAVAGEANVEFFHLCGSEFEEILVGEGARRVRALFRAARSKAPAVIFIDEIDSVGGKRVGSSLQPFANQTINQLLSEMDGFVQNDKIVVIGATNRVSDLDEALLRPGRFDLKVQVHAPDIKGRREILQLYLSKIISKDIDVDRLAKQSVGFTGADLENLVNQAALLAATLGCDYVTTEHFDKAFDKILLGPALKSRVRTKQMSRVIAYHESGHATVAYFTPNSAPPVKATIIPHGRSAGHTMILREEQTMYSKSELLAIIDVKLGGRAAEELIFGPDKVTTGCEDDLQAATECAKEMVCNLGMSDKIGLRTLKTRKKRGFSEEQIGPAAEDEIDEEVKKIIQESYERAKKILKKHAKEHKLLAEKLLEKETLGADEIKEILSQGREEDTMKE